jgi:hypothetical protein
LLSELLVSSALVVATVAMHALGLGLVRRLADGLLAGRTKGLPRIRLILLVVLGLFVLHGLEVWLYGGVYVLLSAVESLRDGVYVSTLAYATLGYSEAAVAERWHLVAAIEGINGILLLGWTTAFFVTTMERVDKRRR